MPLFPAIALALYKNFWSFYTPRFIETTFYFQSETMTASQPTYDGSGYGMEEYTIAKRGLNRGVQNLYTCVDRMLARLEVQKHARAMQDATDNMLKVHPTLRGVLSHIPGAIDASRSRRQHVGSVELNAARWRELQGKRQASYMLPQDVGLNDRDLLSSQRQRTQDLLSGSPPANDLTMTFDRATVGVHPTNNPYCWETPTETLRRNTGTLKRNTAFRRSRKVLTSTSIDSVAHVASPSLGVNDAFHHDVLSKPKIDHSCNFEKESLPPASRLSWQSFEDKMTKSLLVARVDSGVGQSTVGAGMQFSKEVQKRPRIARTFSEILGSEPFVPTALLLEQTCSTKHK